MPFDKPVHVAAVPLTEHAAPVGKEVTVYVVIGAPPLLDGAFQSTVARAFPADAVTAVGAPGTVAGVTALLNEEATESPAIFVAFTENR